MVLVDEVDWCLRRGDCGVEELEAFLPDTHGDASSVRGSVRAATVNSAAAHKCGSFFLQLQLVVQS